ncbi:MAG: hypothetical protein H6739_17670 [Alphaproteobacteria bacterium]|nr:hypothetical protein [Alphaproteobacteria bacterium]
MSEDCVNKDSCTTDTPGKSRKKVAVKKRSTLRVQVCTDTGIPVRKEWVLLVHTGGKPLKMETDDDGVADFVDLPVKKGDWVYVVLPDILEGWKKAGEDPKQITRLKKTTQKTPRYERLGVPGAEPEALQLHRSKTKDELDHLAGRNTGSTYRKHDHTKYCLRTVKYMSERRYVIKVDRLTEEQKFEHFRSVMEDNGARYTTAGQKDYDATNHRYRFTRGAVCNQFVNFFLGYWCNYGGAFRRGGSATSNLAITELDSNLHTFSANGVRFRGYSDGLGPASSAGPGMVKRDFWSRYVNYTHKPLNYVRVKDSDWDGVRGRFADVTLSGGLGTFSVYSITDGVNPSKRVDHHGGLFVNQGGRLRKMAADSGRPIVLKDCPKPSLIGTSTPRQNLHLRIWPVSGLRAGGYVQMVPGGRYRTDAEISGQTIIRPDLSHAVSRFIYWG